jgi:hypothetical protein
VVYNRLNEIFLRHVSSSDSVFFWWSMGRTEAFLWSVSNLLLASVSSSFSCCSSSHELPAACPASGRGLHPLCSSRQRSPGCLRLVAQGEVSNSLTGESPMPPLATYIYCPYLFVILKGFFAHGWLCSIRC